MIRDDLLTDPDVAKRFQREARLAAAFVHPNVVTVYDFGMTAAARAFLVMELLDGITLRDALRRESRSSRRGRLRSCATSVRPWTPAIAGGCFTATSSLRTSFSSRTATARRPRSSTSASRRRSTTRATRYRGRNARRHAPIHGAGTAAR